MSMVKSIILLGMSLFLFFGTIGVNVFSHFCEEEGLAVSYFVEDASICDEHDHDEHHSDHDSDVHKSDCCDEADAGSCCSKSATHLQLQLDFFSEFEIAAIVMPFETVRPIWSPVVSEHREIVRLASCPDPPIRNARQVLLEVQQWLI